MTDDDIRNTYVTGGIVSTFQDAATREEVRVTRAAVSRPLRDGSAHCARRRLALSHACVAGELGSRAVCGRGW